MDWQMVQWCTSSICDSKNVLSVVGSLERAGGNHDLKILMRTITVALALEGEQDTVTVSHRLGRYVGTAGPPLSPKRNLDLP